MSFTEKNLVPNAGLLPAAVLAQRIGLGELLDQRAAVGADRTAFQTDTALFYNSNSAIMVGEALLAYLDAHPLSLTKDRPALRRDPWRDDGLGHHLLAVEVRRRLLAPLPGDTRVRTPTATRPRWLIPGGLR